MEDTTTSEVPSWFKLAYKVGVDAVWERNFASENFAPVEKFTPIEISEIFEAPETPEAAVDLIKNANRAMVSEADLLAEVIGMPPDSFYTTSSQSPVVLNPIKKAWEFHQAQGGRASVRNSERAYAVRKMAREAFGDLGESNCAYYNDIPVAMKYASMVRARIDATGFDRRLVENIISPSTAGLGLATEMIASCIENANASIQKAEGCLGEVAISGLLKGSPKLLDELRGSIDYEKRYLVCKIAKAIALGIVAKENYPTVDVQKTYRDWVQAGITDENNKRFEAAAANFLQAGALGRFIPEIDGAEILTNYERGVALLKQAPENETTKGFAQNVRDQSCHLRGLYKDNPVLIERVNGLLASLTPTTPVASSIA